ncbi:MAG: ATP-dependent DNA helicase RecG [Candidatus Pacebacteria bacterium]|nr:ATP-dependent DNA helicase RecG [Candidatus Paceibacterota bacterium]
MEPGDLIEKHFTRLKPDQKKALQKLGIVTIADLLYHFPARYENAGPTGTIASLQAGTEATLFGTIRKPETRKTWKGRLPVAEAWLEDASGRIKLRWFSQPYIAKTLHEGMVVKVHGKATGTGEKLYLANPTVERAEVSPEAVHESLFTDASGETVDTLYAVYPESKGISSLWFSHAVKKVFPKLAEDSLEDPIPEDIRERYNLPPLRSAIIFMHTPRSIKDAEAARKRFAFQEVFCIQLSVGRLKQSALKEEALPIDVDRERLDAFVKSFPFPATDAQNRAIEDIMESFSKGHPMRRLLEGDVGSGKTAVAAATAYTVATSRPKGRVAGTLQVAYLCPTEILAKQHFSTFVSHFKDHPIPIGLITGSECRKFPSKIKKEESTKISRAQFSKWVANGEIPIVIGTHALVYKSLAFKHLAYTIIDEQHRFGTMHRQKLTQKGGVSPHLLSMTATPIPRTLALTIYGDLDLTVLDQLPLGRKPVITEVLAPEKRNVAYERVRQELALGRQAYVICPRIDEPDPTKEMALQAKSVKAEAVRLQEEIFPTIPIGILHSKMTPIEKERAMELFNRGETKILVATSVVEVGVNVPNATVILIEGAERFGLSQLHQLRGRVIRSSHQAYCFALPESYGEATKNRMKALTTAKNGFELAEYDLSLRGAGELTGARQWGVSDIAMEALRNIKMVEAARKEAGALLERDPNLVTIPPSLHDRLRHAEGIHFE